MPRHTQTPRTTCLRCSAVLKGRQRKFCSDTCRFLSWAEQNRVPPTSDERLLRDFRKFLRNNKDAILRLLNEEKNDEQAK